MAQNGRRGGRKASEWLLWAGIGALGAIVVLIAYFAIVESTNGDDGRSEQTPVVSDDASVTVDVVDNDYEPRHLTVNPGTEVTWRFEGDLPHNVTDEAGGFASDTVGKGAEYARVFDDPGEYHYYCTLHHAMTGTLIVAP